MKRSWNIDLLEVYEPCYRISAYTVMYLYQYTCLQIFYSWINIRIHVFRDPVYRIHIYTPASIFVTALMLTYKCVCYSCVPFFTEPWRKFYMTKLELEICLSCIYMYYISRWIHLDICTSPMYDCIELLNEWLLLKFWKPEWAPGLFSVFGELNHFK